MLGESRVALALPVGSPAATMAATQIVIFLLRLLIRAELVLHTYPAGQLPDSYPVGVGGILFVAAEAAVRRDDTAGRADLEQLVRRRIERAYARQGIRDADYDLQVL
jgi:hypothetical protein